MINRNLRLKLAYSHREDEAAKAEFRTLQPTFEERLAAINEVEQLRRITGNVFAIYLHDADSDTPSATIVLFRIGVLIGLADEREAVLTFIRGMWDLPLDLPLEIGPYLPPVRELLAKGEKLPKATLELSE